MSDVRIWPKEYYIKKDGAILLTRELREMVGLKIGDKLCLSFDLHKPGELTLKVIEKPN